MENNSLTIERLTQNGLIKEHWKFQVFGNKIVLIAYYRYEKENATKAKFAKKVSFDVYDQSKNSITLNHVPQPDEVYKEALETITKPYTVMNWQQYMLSI